MENMQGQKPVAPPPPAPPPDYGMRHGGAGKKGEGYFGPLMSRDGSGKVMTEYSIGIEIDGKEVEVPSMVPGLTNEELDVILRGGMNKSIEKKAAEHARKRMKEGQSPVAGPGERVKAP